jgi:hypothetical protein
VASGVKGALRSTYGNDDAVYLRKNDQADLSLGGTTIRHWFGSDVPTPETVETADGVKITTFGKDVQIREKPNDYLIVDHPKGRSELHVQSGLKINEAKTDGKYSERTFDYANGLKIRQFADGRLHFNLNGVDRYAINKDGKIFNPDANEKVWQANNLPLARSLPARPQISEDNGSHVLTFENGARLHMMPSGMKLVSGGALREMP